MVSAPAEIPDSAATGLTHLSSLARLLRQRARERPDQVLYVSSYRHWTYAELNGEANRLAQGFRSVGVLAGDRVACLTKHGAECALLALAASKLGAIAAPLNWRLAPDELAYVLGRARPKVLLADAFTSENLSATQAEASFIRLVTERTDAPDSLQSWIRRFADEDPGYEPDLDDPAVILFSSGTTGYPKAVELSHRSILTQCREWTEPFGYAADTVHLNVLPTFHVSGIVNALWMLALGARAVFLPEFSPEHYLRAIEQHAITDAFAVPAMLKMLVESPGIRTTNLRSLRCIAYGGSPISEALMLQCGEAFRCGFLQVYGMTEASGTLTALLPHEHDAGGARAGLLRSVGRPGAHIGLRIVEPMSGRVCADDEVGEIQVRSAQLMRGYREDPDATRAVFEDGTDGRGPWMHTGDAGYLKGGYLFLFDRIKDMIISGGENVYPAEVEKVLATHPAVAEVAVIGVPHEKWGETVKACIVSRADAGRDAREIIAFARARLAHYKCPTSVDFLDALPRNPSGKVLKRLLRDPYWRNGPVRLS